MQDGLKTALGLSLCSVLLIDCKTVTTTSASKAAPAEDWFVSMTTPPPPVLCPPGSEFMPLTIVPPQNTAKATDFGFPEKQYIAPVDAKGYTYRLDTCATSDNSLSLVRLAMMRPAIPMGDFRTHPASYFVVNLAPNASIKGLDEAMINSDGRQVSILLPTSGDDAYHLSGTTLNGEALISVFEGRINSPKKSVTDVSYGSLEVNDTFPPLQVGQCNSHEKRSIVKFILSGGNVELAFKGCFAPERGIGPGEVLRIEEVSVRDKKAPGDKADQLIVMKPGDKGFSAGQSSAHHNVCVYYSVRFPHAVYGITQHFKPGNTGAQTESCPGAGDAPALEKGSKTNASVAIGRGGEKVSVDASASLTKTVTEIK